MSIHDIDKNSPGRVSPMPNSHDVHGIGPIAAGTVSINPTTDATSSSGHIITKNQQVIANDGVYNKALLGFQSGLGKWGLFVAKDNVDVTTNTDLSQFILNSSQDAFKVVASDTAVVATSSLTGSAGSFSTVTDSLTIPHTLGYIPIVVAHMQFSSGVYRMIPFGSTFAGINSSTCFWYQWYIVATSTNIQIIRDYTMYGNLGIPSANWVFKYYILQETAN